MLHKKFMRDEMKEKLCVYRQFCCKEIRESSIQGNTNLCFIDTYFFSIFLQSDSSYHSPIRRRICGIKVDKYFIVSIGDVPSSSVPLLCYQAVCDCVYVCNISSMLWSFDISSALIRSSVTTTTTASCSSFSIADIQCVYVLPDTKRQMAQFPFVFFKKFTCRRKSIPRSRKLLFNSL